MIWSPIEVQPPHLYFTPTEGEAENETKTVRIVSNLDEDLTLEEPRTSNPAFRIALKTVKAGREFELEVVYSTPVTSEALQGAITIKTSAAASPTLNLTANVMPQPALALMPTQITLPAEPLGAEYVHSQIILNNSHVPMKVTEAAVNAEGVAVDINEVKPGKMFMLTVRFPASFHYGDRPLELTVRTSSSRHAVIKLPIEQTATGSAADSPTLPSAAAARSTPAVAR